MEEMECVTMDLEERRRMMLATEQNRFWIFKSGKGLLAGTLTDGTDETIRLVSVNAYSEHIIRISHVDLSPYSKLVIQAYSSYSKIGDQRVGVFKSTTTTIDNHYGAAVTSESETEYEIDVANLISTGTRQIGGTIVGGFNLAKLYITNIWLE